MFSDGEALLALVIHLKGEAEKQGVRLVQCLLEPDAALEVEVLRQAGFRRLARLDFLSRELSLAAGLSGTVEAGPALSWVPYGPTVHAQFARTVMETYQGTLDCPGLNGLRTIEDILAGHKAAAVHDPAWWRLLVCDGPPVGCVLLGEVPFRRALELIYMGVVPGARRGGIGATLLREAVRLGRATRLERITLAVDAANTPARRLYERFGFEPCASREAWIAVPLRDAKG